MELWGSVQYLSGFQLAIFRIPVPDLHPSDSQEMPLQHCNYMHGGSSRRSHSRIAKSKTQRQTLLEAKDLQGKRISTIIRQF